MSVHRLCLIIAAFLFALAGILSAGGLTWEPFALFGFGFWAVAGAV